MDVNGLTFFYLILQKDNKRKIVENYKIDVQMTEMH